MSARPDRPGTVRLPLTGPRLPARLRNRRPLAMPPVAGSHADRS